MKRSCIAAAGTRSCSHACPTIFTNAPPIPSHLNSRHSSGLFPNHGHPTRQVYHAIRARCNLILWGLAKLGGGNYMHACCIYACTHRILCSCQPLSTLMAQILSKRSSYRTPRPPPLPPDSIMSGTHTPASLHHRPYNSNIARPSSKLSLTSRLHRHPLSFTTP